MPLSHLRKRGGKLLNLFFRSERVSVSVGDEEQATPKIVSPRSEPGSIRIKEKPQSKKPSLGRSVPVPALVPEVLKTFLMLGKGVAIEYNKVQQSRREESIRNSRSSIGRKRINEFPYLGSRDRTSSNRDPCSRLGSIYPSIRPLSSYKSVCPTGFYGCVLLPSILCEERLPLILVHWNKAVPTRPFRKLIEGKTPDSVFPASRIKHQQGIEIEHEDQGWSPGLLLKLEEQRRRNQIRALLRTSMRLTILSSGCFLGSRNKDKDSYSEKKTTHSTSELRADLYLGCGVQFYFPSVLAALNLKIASHYLTTREARKPYP
ncbi:hypothetical protein QYF36_014297 [Acer negundo]|nr:hypothetical protein QYF36_014297 [Acer negundo]